MVTKKLSWTSEVAKCFALFEIEENYFCRWFWCSWQWFWCIFRWIFCFALDRKLHALELPHSMYIHNYNTYVSTCICLRKFLFSPSLELSLITNPTILSLVYHQVRFNSYLFILTNELWWDDWKSRPWKIWMMD